MHKINFLYNKKIYCNKNSVGVLVNQVFIMNSYELFGIIIRHNMGKSSTYIY